MKGGDFIIFLGIEDTYFVGKAGKISLSAILDDFIEINRKEVQDKFQVDLIIEACCSHYNITTKQIQKKSRVKEIVEARQMAMYITFKFGRKMSLSKIGELIGNKDHSTVLHSIKEISKNIEIYKSYRNSYTSILKLLKNEIDI